jgi:hypothetical protein
MPYNCGKAIQMNSSFTGAAILEVILEATLSVIAKAIVDAINALPSGQSPKAPVELGSEWPLVKVDTMEIITRS